MKLALLTLLLTACCLWTLSLPGCSLMAGKAAPRPAAAAPKPAPAAPDSPEVETAADLPISVPQTQVTLPSPQPIQAEALSVVKVESPPVAPPAPPAKPRPAPRSEPRQPATTTANTQPAPAVPVAPPPPVASRPRIRPVESAAERQRLTAEIATKQKHVQENLGKARSRQLSEAEKNTLERVLAFLEQTDAALRDQDLQQAAALSSRALLLSQELNPEK